MPVNVMVRHRRGTQHISQLIKVYSHVVRPAEHACKCHGETPLAGMKPVGQLIKVYSHVVRPAEHACKCHGETPLAA
jgi:hypothetical protein